MHRGDARENGVGATGARENALGDALAIGRAFTWRVDAGGAFACAGAAADLLGAAPRSRAELDALVHEADRAAREAAIAGAVAQGGAWQCVYRAAATPARWIEERGRAAARGGGAPALAALGLDITDRHRSEAGLEDLLRRESRARQAAELATGTAEAALRALARSEAFLESIFSAMTDGIVLLDAAGRVTRVNPSARAMLAFGDDVTKLSFAERLLHLEVRDVEGRMLPPEALPAVAALRGELVQSVPLRLRFPDGRVLWATVGAAPIRAPGGEVAGAVLSLGDVSRLRELQEQREDLSRTIAHDLRTPLNVISAQAKLLARRADSAEAVRARADAISKCAHQMAAMLQDLVESALLEAGKLRLDLAPVDVDALLRDLRRRLAAAYGDRIVVVAEPALPRLLADAARLERILTNLLTNACKYSPTDREVTVRVAAGLEELAISVEDQGAGIAPCDLPRIFERWFRAGATQALEGMGLGLYTTRMLVEAHGGHIDVTSEAGRGSVFKVRLPLVPPKR
ncbi:MAG: ATP-binding protein [Anaeromyxobacteraceae bacterium]